MRKILNLPKPPTAIFATNLYMTIGMISVLNERNMKLGQDISAIGYDSIFISDIVQPKLTLIEQPLDKAGKLIADVIVGRMKQKDEKQELKIYEIPTTLIEGDSVKNINNTVTDVNSK